MIREIIKEKTSADHLLYVSMKYTKTCDVILNLIARWESMICVAFDALLKKALKDKKIPALPNSPKQRVEFMKLGYKKSEIIQQTIALYIFFKKVPELNKTREGEFRKNVNLKVMEPGKITMIDMEKLKEYAELLEKFISEVKHLLA